MISVRDVVYGLSGIDSTLALDPRERPQLVSTARRYSVVASVVVLAGVGLLGIAGYIWTLSPRHTGPVALGLLGIATICVGTARLIALVRLARTLGRRQPSNER